MQRLLIDTDTASDDAIALVMALRTPDVQVEAITVTAGNVALEQALQNALYTVELCGARVPVYAGRHAPLLRPLETAVQVHGSDGMSDIGLPLRGRSPAAGHAVDVIIERIMTAREPLTLVTLGPLSNIALALLKEPAIARRVARCIVMGGTSDGSGNVTPVAEYNIWTDPEAAQIVFGSGLPITMVGWDVSRTAAVVTPDEAVRLRAHGTATAHFCHDIQAAVTRWCRENTDMAGPDLPDPLAMAVALDERIATRTTHAPVVVVTGDGISRGQTVVDARRVLTQGPACTVVTAADRTRFFELLNAAVA